jgi:hypothetical protein
MECTVNMDLRIHYGEINRTVSVPLTGGACLTIGRHGERCEQNSVSAIKNPALIITWVTYSNPAMCVANASMPNHPVSR